LKQPSNTLNSSQALLGNSSTFEPTESIEPSALIPRLAIRQGI